MNVKNRKIVIATVVMLVIVSLLTIGYAVVSDSLAEIEATGHIKSGPILEYSPTLSYGSISAPSVNNQTILLANVGEEDTGILTFSTNKTIEGLTLSWDYGGAPILAGDTMLITFTLTVLEGTPTQDFAIGISIKEV